MAKYVYGPTFDEMLHPETIPEEMRKRAKEARVKDPLNRDNLFNICWRDEEGKIPYFVLPKALTGVDCNICVMYSKNFPTGSHKVGATYSVTMEYQLLNKIKPGETTVVWPSTGNYGIGGAWVSGRMGYDGLVLLPERMSAERFKKIESYGCRYIKTPGCESNVAEIYQACAKLEKEPNTVIANQFAEFANYRFHYHVTGNTMVEVAKQLKEKGIGNGRIAAVTSAMGSAGTIASADRVKQVFYEAKICGLEPIQCPTLYNNGYGDHDIQGIGDKHVTWIHNVTNMDAIICVDDVECKQGLQLLTDPAGKKYLIENAGIDAAAVEKMASIFGISGVCNVIGAIKAAKYYKFGPNETVFTVCTDTMDRYGSVMQQLDETYGKMDVIKAAVRHEKIFKGQKLDYIEEGTMVNRQRWHNLKYYSWVEQLGKSLPDLERLRSQDFWLEQQAKIPEIVAAQKKARGF